MTCDEARALVLQEIGGESDGDEARLHLSACPPCDDYRRDAERVWDLAGHAVESCPRREQPLSSSRPRRGPALAAAAIIAATVLAAWLAWPALRNSVARQDPDAGAEELLRKDPEFRKQVLRTAMQEKDGLAEFEKKLSASQEGYVEAKKLLDAGKPREAADRAESALSSFPYLKLVVLDATEQVFRSTVLKLRLRELAATAQIALLRDEPAPPSEEAARTEAQIRLMNQLREYKRQLELLLARGPQPKKDVRVDLGGAELPLRSDTLDKLRSIRITISFQDGSMKDIVAYLREISGLNMVLLGTPPERETKVSIQLKDAVCEALLDYMTKEAGYTWEVDRFGIVAFKPAKK